MNTINNNCENVDINCSPVEWLIIHQALKEMSMNKNVHPSDKKILDEMLKIEMQRYEHGD